MNRSVSFVVPPSGGMNRSVSFVVPPSGGMSRSYHQRRLKAELLARRLKAELRTAELRTMYDYRKMTPKQRAEAVAYRRRRGQPLHSPPHWDLGISNTYLI